MGSPAPGKPPRSPPQFDRELMSRYKNSGLRRNASLIEVAEQHSAALAFPVADRPLDRLCRLAQPRRAFDEQPPDPGSVLNPASPDHLPTLPTSTCRLGWGSFSGLACRRGSPYAVARARWRRCFALSLALRLLARIVLLGLAVFFTRGTNLADIEPFLIGIVVGGYLLLPRPAPAT
jgi:hypothetical protein